MRTSLCLPVLALVAIACDLPPGGDGGQDMAESTTCVVSYTALGSVDEVSSIVGISGSDVLATVSSPYVVAATYPDNDATGQIPAAGSLTELTLTVEYAGGWIGEADAVLEQGADEMYVECHPFIDIEVVVGLATADGAFAETWTGDLKGYAADTGLPPELAVLAPSLDALEGSFQIGSLQSDYALVTEDLELSSDLDPEGPTGEIVQYYTFESGDADDGVTGQAIYRLLTWGQGE